VELRSRLGDWIFGCDICQLVCPWNKDKADEPRVLAELQPRQELLDLNLIEEMGLDQEGFSSRFKGSPIKRAKRKGYLRNIALVLGNLGDPDAIPILQRALDDPEPLVREAARWALEKLDQASGSRSPTGKRDNA
jgi:epoxyqueuosine reductase